MSHLRIVIYRLALGLGSSPDLVNIIIFIFSCFILILSLRSSFFNNVVTPTLAQQPKGSQQPEQGQGGEGRYKIKSLQS